jgi:hypothetical protein
MFRISSMAAVVADASGRQGKLAFALIADGISSKGTASASGARSC